MKVIRAGVIALVLAGMLVTMNQLTYRVIEDNKSAYANRQIAEMIGDREFKETDAGYEIYEGGEIYGFIQPTVTPHGYNGDIHLLIAFDLSKSILSVRVTDHQETPGLGDAIDKEWIGNFDGRTTKTRWALKPEGDIDGITGATITARAVVDAVAEVISP